MKCLHHLDMDGRSAASIVARYYNDYNKNHYFEMDYDTPWPFDNILYGETVVIVDFSIQESLVPQLQKLLTITKDIIWIDHHASSTTMLESHPEYNSIAGIRMEGICGAGLTWLYYYNTARDKVYDISFCPYWIRLISDYDCFQHNIKFSAAFKLGIDAEEDQSPTSQLWIDLFNDKVKPDKYIETGNTVKRFLNSYYKDLRNMMMYTNNYNGHKVAIMNLYGDSNIFGSAYNEYDFCCRWYFDGKVYKYSLYSCCIDVKNIAEQYGGGGHKKAAGFTSKELVDWCKI